MQALTPYRYRSPFLFEFPWRNGCLLEQGPLAAWVRAHAPHDCPLEAQAFIQVRDQESLLPPLTHHRISRKRLMILTIEAYIFTTAIAMSETSCRDFLLSPGPMAQLRIPRF
jgi:hypothetical protein